MASTSTVKVALTAAGSIVNPSDSRRHASAISTKLWLAASFPNSTGCEAISTVEASYPFRTTG